MKTYYFPALLTCLISLAAGAPFSNLPSYSYNGVRIEKDFAIEADFDIEMPRKSQDLSIDKAVAVADGFLAKAFGKLFKPPIHRVGLTRQRSTKGGQELFWAWQICYFDPEHLEDSRNARLFYVYVSLSGEILMKSTDDKDDK